MSAPETVEVFGEDGELFSLLVEDAPDDALEDGIQILEHRRCAMEADIRGLRALLASRRGEPKSAEAVRAESRQQAVDGLLALLRGARS